jgi:hypothetical protein
VTEYEIRIAKTLDEFEQDLAIYGVAYTRVSIADEDMRRISTGELLAYEQATEKKQ